jgi:hypothetical protein
MKETRSQRTIRFAVERYGGELTRIEWQPIGQMIEMAGREGGWTVFARMPWGEDHFLGYSTAGVIDSIGLSARLYAKEDH